MRIITALSLILLSAGLSACGTTPSRLHYSTTAIGHTAVTKAQRSPLLARARAITKDHTLRFRRGAGRYKTIKRSALNALPLAALQAIHMVGHERFYGAEIDLLIKVKGRGSVPVSARIDLKGNLTLDMGGKHRARPKEVDVAPKFRKGKVKWTAKSQRVVVHAISLLPPAEARIVKNVPFSRHRAGKGHNRDKGAIYIQRGCGAEVRVFNSSFKSDRLSFTGEARSPKPASARVVLHEIGHAIHNFPGRRASCAYVKAGDKLKARIKKYNRVVAKANATRDPALARFLKQEGPRIKRQQAKIDRMGKAAAALSEAGPVLAAYARVLGRSQAPTVYGESSIRESFAESFSLYRADPRALDRLLPAVLAWFKADGHLKAMK